MYIWFAFCHLFVWLQWVNPEFLNTIYNTWCSRWRKYGLIIYKSMVSQCWQLAKFQLPSPGNGQQYRSWCCSVTRPQETREAFEVCPLWSSKEKFTPFAKHEILKRLPWQLSYCTYCLRLQCWRSADSLILSSYPPRQVSPVPRLRWMFTHCELQRHWWAYGGHMQHLGFQTQPVNLHPVARTLKTYSKALSRAC